MKYLLLFLTCLSAYAVPPMAVTRGVTGNLVTTNTTIGGGGGGGSVTRIGAVSTNTQSSTASLTWSHTVTSGTDMLVVTGTSYQLVPTGATFNGVAMTSAGTAPDSGDDVAWIFYLAAPSATTANVVVSFAGSTGCNGGAFNYDGATGVGGYQGSTASASLSVSSQTGALVINVLSQYNVDPTIGAGQTWLWAYDNGAGYQSGYCSEEAGAASVTMSFTGTAGTFAHAALSINP